MANFFHVFMFHEKYLFSSRNSTLLFDEQDPLWIRLCVESEYALRSEYAKDAESYEYA